MQLKQAILREIKQQLANEAKEKGHLEELFRSLHNQTSSLKSEIGFLREELKGKNNAIRTLLRRNSGECRSSSPCESPKRDKISEKKKNEESCDTCIPITPNPIQSDHNRQFTKLAKKKAEQKIDKLIVFLKHIPDETTHLTNKLRSQLWMR